MTLLYIKYRLQKIKKLLQGKESVYAIGNSCFYDKTNEVMPNLVESQTANPNYALNKENTKGYDNTMTNGAKRYYRNRGL